MFFRFIDTIFVEASIRGTIPRLLKELDEEPVEIKVRVIDSVVYFHMIGVLRRYSSQVRTSSTH